MEECYSYAPLPVVIGFAFIVLLQLIRCLRLGLPNVAGETSPGVVRQVLNALATAKQNVCQCFGQSARGVY